MKPVYGCVDQQNISEKINEVIFQHIDEIHTKLRSSSSSTPYWGWDTKRKIKAYVRKSVKPCLKEVDFKQLHYDTNPCIHLPLDDVLNEIAKLEKHIMPKNLEPLRSMKIRVKHYPSNLYHVTLAGTA